MTNLLEPRELMRRHVEALFICDARGRLVAVNEVKGGSAPRFFFGGTADGPQCRFRNDVGRDLIKELTAAAQSIDTQVSEEVVDQVAAEFARILEASAPVERRWSGPVYAFPGDLRADARAVHITPNNAEALASYLGDWLDDVEHGFPITAVLEGGNAVSVCCSVRVTAEAHEAGVETHPSFRRKGYAATATAAWARRVRAAGIVPLYSTSWENVSSRAVARKLGLVQFGTDLHLT